MLTEVANARVNPPLGSRGSTRCSRWSSPSSPRRGRRSGRPSGYLLGWLSQWRRARCDEQGAEKFE